MVNSEKKERSDPFGEEAPLIDLEELKGWIIYEDDGLIVFNKPGWVVCHPSKNGPLSSLVGACREYTGLEKLHLVSRLDRETSGIVLFAKHRKMARICQMAVEFRRVNKFYTVLLTGELEKEVLVDEPLAKDIESPVHVKQCVREDRTAKRAKTLFKPVYVKNGYTLAEVELYTGRKHQIRAHALWLGHPVVGDKLYGPDETLYLEFIEKGWTERLGEMLPLKRQALHATRMEFDDEEYKEKFRAPLHEDMKEFCKETMGLSEGEISEL